MYLKKGKNKKKGKKVIKKYGKACWSCLFVTEDAVDPLSHTVNVLYNSISMLIAAPLLFSSVASPATHIVKDKKEAMINTNARIPKKK